MRNISHDINNVNALQEENRQLYEKLEEVSQQNIRLQKRVKKLEQRENWYKSLVGLPNTKLSAVDKVVTLATLWDVERRDKRPAERNPVFYQNIEEGAGVSRSTVIKSIDTMAKSEAIDKNVQRDKQGKKHVSIAFTPQFLAAPECIVEQLPESNHGGDKRKPCSCGCETFHKRVVTKGTRQTIITCKACGEIQSDDTVLLDNVANTVIKAFDEDEDNLPSFDDIEEMHIDEEVVDIPDEEYIPAFDEHETPTLFPVEKKPVPVPVGLFPNRPCYGCNTTNWKAYTDEGIVKAYCSTCEPHKGN